MIDWFYSVAGFWTGVTNDVQKFLVTSKTIVNASNRFRVVSNVVCGDFMQFQSTQTSNKSLAPRGAVPSPPDACTRSSSSEARPGFYYFVTWDFTIGFCDFVTGPKSRCWMACSRTWMLGESPRGAWELVRHPEVSQIA